MTTQQATQVVRAIEAVTRLIAHAWYAVANSKPGMEKAREEARQALTELKLED